MGSHTPHGSIPGIPAQSGCSRWRQATASGDRERSQRSPEPLWSVGRYSWIKCYSFQWRLKSKFGWCNRDIEGQVQLLPTWRSLLRPVQYCPCNSAGDSVETTRGSSGSPLLPNVTENEQWPWCNAIIIWVSGWSPYESDVIPNR